MNHVKAPSWLALGSALALAGCSTVAPATQPQAAGPEKSAVSAPMRSTQAQAPMSFEQISQHLPKRITQAEADKMLVELPANQLQGSLVTPQGERSTQQFWRFRSFRYFPYRSFYFPYYLSSGYYYPYYSYASPYYYYPYYSYSYTYPYFYRPYYYYGFRRFW